MTSSGIYPDSPDLSDILFSPLNSGVTVDSYVNPKIRISSRKSQVTHGRGMIASEDIASGECLFVTPPTVYADQKETRQRFMNQFTFQPSQTPIMSVEDVAMDLLIDSMMACINNDQCTFTNSFLMLMGKKRSPTNVEEEHVSITTLLGKDREKMYSDDDRKEVTRNDVMNIILKNAFGPDFITYDKIQQYWQSNIDFCAPHLLGIYPLAAMLNHSCLANAVRSYAGETMIVHAATTIPAGMEITWSYIPPTQTFAERRRALKKRHGFVCQCERCVLEGKYLKKDILPSTLKRALEDASRWNDSLLDVASSEESAKHQLCAVFLVFEDTVLSSTSLSNELKRYLRVAFTNLHFNYFNAILSALANKGNANQVRETALASATQLHFAFCSSHNSSTEHLSVLHLCYELVNAIHQTSSVKNQKKTITKVRFWTEQMKKAHLLRYGSMKDLSNVRKCMVHTRTILRQQDGYLKAQSNFL